MRYFQYIDIINKISEVLSISHEAGQGTWNTQTSELYLWFCWTTSYLLNIFFYEYMNLISVIDIKNNMRHKYAARATSLSFHWQGARAPVVKMFFFSLLLFPGHLNRDGLSVDKQHLAVVLWCTKTATCWTKHYIVSYYSCVPPLQTNTWGVGTEP